MLMSEQGGDTAFPMAGWAVVRDRQDIPSSHWGNPPPQLESPRCRQLADAPSLASSSHPLLPLTQFYQRHQENNCWCAPAPSSSANTA